MFQNLIDGFHQLPEYFSRLVSGPYLIWFILALVVYLLVTFLNGPVMHILRLIVIIALLIGAVVSYVYYRNYPQVLVCIGAVLIMLLFRLFAYIIQTLRQDHVNRAIERRQLEKAAMRRGAHKHDFGVNADKMNEAEIKDVVDNETLGGVQPEESRHF